MLVTTLNQHFQSMNPLSLQHSCLLARALPVTEKLKKAVNRGEPVARNPQGRNLNGRSRGPKGQEANFHPDISEFQVKCVSSHKCLTKLLRKGTQSGLVSYKCLTKLHATKWQSLSTSRSSATDRHSSY